MTKGKHKKKVTQKGKSGSPENQGGNQTSRPMEESSPANDVIQSAGLLSVTGCDLSMGVAKQQPVHAQQSMSFCHSEVLIKNISMTKGTPPQQQSNQVQTNHSSEHQKYRDDHDHDVTLTGGNNLAIQNMTTPARQLSNIAKSTPSSVKKLSGSARRNRKKLNSSTSSVNSNILDLSHDSMDTGSPVVPTKGQVSSTPKRSLTADLETPMSLTKKPRSNEQNTMSETGTIPKPLYLEQLKSGLLANAPPVNTEGASASSHIRPPAFVAYIDTTNGAHMTQLMANHIRDSLIQKLYDPPGFSAAPARFLQYGLVVNPLTSNNIFKVTCADSKSVDWVLSAGNSLPRYEFTSFKTLRWNQLPKPISLFTFFVRKTESDAETVKHNLARSNPEINIRKWKVHRCWEKKNGILVCFGVDPVSFRWIQTHDMRLYFELGTVEFRLPHNKEQPQSGSGTDTRTDVTGTAAAETRPSGLGTDQPPIPISNSQHLARGATSHTDTSPGTVSKTDTRAGTAGKVGTAGNLSTPVDEAGGAAGYADTSTGTVHTTDTRTGTASHAGTTSANHQNCKSS